MIMDYTAFGDIIFFAVLVAPFLFLYWMIMEAWIYIREYYWVRWYTGINYIVLEIKLPKEQYKTPQAMEMVFNGIWEPGDSNGWKQDWLGLNTFDIISFEMVSLGGSIHFFFWVPEKYKPRVEAHVYAHFPQAEVTEVPDYTRMIPYDNATHKIMGFEYKQNDKDPIPIRTYKDMGLDKPSKEEEKMDPITQTLEVLGSIGPHEHMWIQFVCRTHKKRYKVPFKSWGERFSKIIEDKNPMWLFLTPEKDWSVELDNVINEIKEKYKPPSKDELLPMGGMATPQDNDLLKRVSENASKPGFEVGIRQIYFAPEQYYDKRQPSNMGSAFKAYSAAKPYNNVQPGLIPVGNDKWWEPGHAAAAQQVKDGLFSDYAHRKFFNAHSVIPYFYGKMYKTFVLSTEELATLYHFPGSVAQTPTFERLPSTTVEAPANLPIGEVPGNLPM